MLTNRGVEIISGIKFSLIIENNERLFYFCFKPPILMPSISLQPPADKRVNTLIASYATFPLSYPHEGMTKTMEVPPKGYRRDDYQIRLGEGEACFHEARNLIEGWGMFSLPWVKLHHGEKGQRIGQDVVVCFHLLSTWWTSPCRVIYVVNEARRYGFAYGTLPPHVEKGEELFEVVWKADDSVWYHIKAISRPGWWGVWMVYPWSRRLQRRFGRQSCQRMKESIDSMNSTVSPS